MDCWPIFITRYMLQQFCLSVCRTLVWTCHCMYRPES